MSSATANMPIERRRYSRKVDRLSHLPTEILVSILSRLGHVEAVRASLLSSKWKGLWRKTGAKLIFSERPIWVPPECRHRLQQQRYIADRGLLCDAFVGYVNRFLALPHHQQTPAVDEFAVSFTFTPESSDAVDAWLRFAFTKGVGRLELNLRPACRPCVPLSFEPTSYSFPAIGVLLGFAGRRRNLKELCLQWVDVGHGFEGLLSGFPLLERLSIKYVESLDLKLVGPSRLKMLEIYCPCHYELPFNVEITSTNLLQLKYYAPNSTLCVKTNRLLSDLKLYGTHVETFLRSPSHDSFHYIFQQLHKLTLGMPHQLSGGPICTPPRFPEFNKLVQLELIMQLDLCKPRTSWTFAIIKAAPLLHRFAVKFVELFTMGSSGIEILDALIDGQSLELAFHELRDVLRGGPMQATEFSHDHLKVVEVSGFGGLLIDVKFVEQLLRIGKSLEEVVINIVQCEEADPIPRGYKGDTFSNWRSHRNFEQMQKHASDVAYSLEKKLPFGSKLRVVCD